MAKINKMTTMNIREAVLYSESRISAGMTGFFVNTDFGKVGVEINPFHTIDPLHSITILTWEQCPETMWAVKHKDSDADYYVGINIFAKSIMDHSNVIEAFSRVMLFNLGIQDPSDNAVNAMVESYKMNYDETMPTINSMMAEYCLTHMNMAVRGFQSVQTVVREMIQQRIDTARDIIDIGKELLGAYINNNAIPEESFVDKYSEEVFGVLLYCHMRNKKDMDSVLANIISFKDRESQELQRIAVGK